MFGESESESPRVPSPWDSLMSSPPSPVSRPYTPSPLAVELIPRLVPEADDGNVEYKLQLLNPSPARFARLVTQMKWRLLEGGGQAYYELGVADSGDLIGLPREDLEQSLETLEMMAGEIGASVIVVKEIEVPAAMAALADAEARRNGGRRTLNLDQEHDGGYSTVTTETETETETDESGTDAEDLSLTVVLVKDGAPAEPTSRFAIDLEISSVFKPRPIRTRVHNHPHYAHSVGGKSKRAKKPHKYPANGAANGDKDSTSTGNETTKAHVRRQGRDRRREDRKKTLEAHAMHAGPVQTETTAETTVLASTENITASLAGLTVERVVVEEPLQISTASESLDLNSADALAIDNDDIAEDDDDVFAPPRTAVPFRTFSSTSTGESHLDLDPAAIEIVGSLAEAQERAHAGVHADMTPRLIVEALVVRKMSIGEGFLDFGGFSLT